MEAVKVKLLANLSASGEFLPEDLQAFFGPYRQIRPELEERPSAEIVRGIEDGVADIGICSSGASTRALTTRSYQKDRLVALIPEGHCLAAYDALTLVDTLTYDYVGLHAASSILRQSQQAVHQAGLHFHVRTHVSSFDALCHMVQAGVGSSLIPYHVFRVLGQAIGLRALLLRDVWAELAPGSRLLFDHLTGALHDK